MIGLIRFEIEKNKSTNEYEIMDMLRDCPIESHTNKKYIHRKCARLNNDVSRGMITEHSDPEYSHEW